jgi:MoxR-like ATPase
MSTTQNTHLTILDKIKTEIKKNIIGQEELVDKLLIALICNGHVLIEGVPGLAKTLTINSLSKTLQASFSRIQFTPDLLPGDLLGTLIYNPNTNEFTPHKGPIFANIILADEINRSPAKVQSALLEAMQEKQVTIGDTSYKLDTPFLVLATQNPIEQEGTYPLPEAQVDRFMFKLKVTYPTIDEEHRILKLMAKTVVPTEIQPVATLKDILSLREKLDTIYLDEKIEKYIIRIIDATRNPENYGLDLKDYISFGASPRATIFFALASKGLALLNNREYVVPEDIKEIAYDILRHRIAITYKAEALNKNSEYIIEQILNNVDIP